MHIWQGMYPQKSWSSTQWKINMHA